MKPDDVTSRGANSNRTDLDWPHHAGAVDRVLEAVELKVRQRRGRFRQRCMSLGAVAALAFGAFVWRGTLDAPADFRRDVAASSAVVSAPVRQVLTDGSIVELKEDGRIAVEFTPDMRRVTLQAGEAHFQVTKDSRRPFVVRAGGVDVRAVGTAFSVQLGKDAADVLVTQGTVSVDQPRIAIASRAEESSLETQTLATLGAGNRIIVEIAAATPAAAVATTVSEAEQMQRLAWRVPKLEFSATPLADAVPLVNQYSGVKLEIADASLARIELSGVLRADNIDTLLQLLTRDYGIKVQRVGEDRILLFRKPAGGR